MSDDGAFFAAHGWLVLRGVVPRERVAALESAVDAIFRASPGPVPGQVWELPAPSRVNALIAAHARNAEIARHVALALGAASVQLLQDTALVKPARQGGVVAWHQDHTYTGYLRPARVASARLALTECNVGNGCMEVIDGSHQWGPIGDVRALTETRIEDILGERAAEWAEHVVPLELEPGDVSIHHCLTLHRSGANASPEARKTLITRIFDASCTLEPSRLPPGAAAHFPTSADGRLSEKAFPVLWSG